LLDAGALHRLARGQFYGLTRRGSEWLAFQKLGKTGRLLRFELDRRARWLRAETVGPVLSEGCHQIDLIGDRLFVADSYNNRVLVLEESRRQLHVVQEMYPAGRLDRGRESHNYVHLNSLWRSPNGVLAVLHNETRKTGRPSEIVLLDARGEIRERKATGASHAHNILEYRGRHLYCDSNGGTLRWGGDVAFQCELFTRGLAVTPEHILLGGSAYASREQRTQVEGRLYILDRAFRALGSIPIPGMVQEIRGIDGDLGLSNDATVYSSARSAAAQPRRFAFA
jgi:hypothetical protein